MRSRPSGFSLRAAALLDHQDVIGGEHDLIALVQDFAALDDAALARPARVVLLCGDGDARADRVADEDRPDKAQAIVTIREGHWIDQRRREPDADRKNHRAMRDALAEGRRLHELGVEVMGKEISRVAGVDDKVGLGNRATVGQPDVAELVILIVDRLFDHESPFIQGRGESGVAGAALERYAASTSAMVIQASSTLATSAASSPAAKRCRLAMRPMKASGNQPPASGTSIHSDPPFGRIDSASGSPRG